MIWCVCVFLGNVCHERIIQLDRLYYACARVVLWTLWLSSRSLMNVIVKDVHIGLPSCKIKSLLSLLSGCNFSVIMLFPSWCKY